MRKFIRSTCIIICIVIVIAVIYNNNLTIEQKIGRNQEDVLGYKKRDISDLEKYAIQEGFEYKEFSVGSEWSNYLEKKYNMKNSKCTKNKSTSIYDGSPYKIEYYCATDKNYMSYIYDFKNNKWYSNKVITEKEKDFMFDDNDHILLPSGEQEIFNQEFKEIHEEIKKGVEKFKEK